MGHLRVVDAPSFSAFPHAVIRDTRVSRDARLLYAVLQMHWWQGGECWAANATLAVEMGCSDSQLRRYLHELLAAGWITARMRGQGQGKAYAPTKPLPSDGQASTGERFNRSQTDGSDGNRSPVEPQPFTDERFNRSPVTDRRRLVNEDSLKEEDTGVIAAADAAPQAERGKPKRRASRLAEDATLTADHLEAAVSIGLSPATADAEWAQFVDYHHAKGSTMSDWLAAWRTWCRNSLKFGTRRNGQYGASAQNKPAPPGVTHPTLGSNGRRRHVEVRRFT